MPSLNFHKVSTLPGTLQADSIYFVVNGSHCETYITTSAAVAKNIGNSTMINALVSSALTSALATNNLLEIVANIVDRNTLASQDRNMLVLVTDATGDPSVGAGAALYAFRNSDNTWHKVSEYEGLDVTLSWASISGKPTSAPSLIDDAVTKRHEHTNIASLNKIGESAGVMTYDGQTVGMSWATTNW